MTVSDAQKKANKKYFDNNYKQVKLSMPIKEAESIMISKYPIYNKKEVFTTNIDNNVAMEVIIPRLIFVLKEFNIKITITVSKAPLQIFIPIKNSPAKQFITCLFFLSSSQAFFKLYSSKSPL